MEIFIKDVLLEQEDKIEIMKIWDNPIVSRHLDSLILDFNFIHQNMSYQLGNEDEDTINLIKIEKIKLLNSFIGGFVCTFSPESNLSKNYTNEDGESVSELNKKEKSNDFANSLKL